MKLKLTVRSNETLAYYMTDGENNGRKLEVGSTIVESNTITIYNSPFGIPRCVVEVEEIDG